MSMVVAATALAAIPFMPMPNSESWPYIVMSGLLELGYNLFLVKAYRGGDLGETYPIARGTSPLLVTLGAAVFADEQVSVSAMQGILLISGGIIALAIRSRRPNLQYLPAALATGCFIAAYTVVDGVGVRLSGDSFAYTAWRYLLGAIPMPFIFLALRGRGAFAAPLPEVFKAGAGGLVALTAYGCIIWALQLSAMGPISALRETSVLFAVVIGRIFLNEPLTPTRVIACVVISAGAACLGFRW